MSSLPEFSRLVVCAVILACCCSTVMGGGGSSENLLLIIDPSSPESIYVGNYYKNARNIPDCNVLYMPPVACDFESHRGFQLKALLGELNGRQLLGHIDYVVVPPGSSYCMSASGYVQDGCSPVRRFSTSAAYTMSHVADDVASGVQMLYPNFYYGQPGMTDIAIAFDGGKTWYYGVPVAGESYPKYLIGAMLGYSGPRGNSIEEILDMIDRSVAADGTRPEGTFYLMETTDDLRSGPRDEFFDQVVSEIWSTGNAAEHLFGVLPDGRHDCLGVMTGWASPAISTADMTLIPGAFCDHLTSYAARFDTGSQVKVSEWISKGASGSWGAVEEPCNYPGKFPHARVHRYYCDGLSLGEAVFRSVQYFPFQMLLYGDPATAPFAHLPTVEVPDAPAGPVSGVFSITPTASTSHPTAGIGYYELFLDGCLIDTSTPEHPFEVDSRKWSDGVHELRVVAYDNTPVASAGRWMGTVITSNHGRGVSLTCEGNASGNLGSTFVFSALADGGDVDEIQLVSSNRVLAAQSGSQASWSIPGGYLGAGPVAIRAVAEFTDGHRAASNAIELEIDYASSGNRAEGSRLPQAFSYSKKIPINQPSLIELPAFVPDGTSLSYSLVNAPAKAAVIGGVGPTVLVEPAGNASGIDTLEFAVLGIDQESATGTVFIEYGFRAGDWDEDGDLDLADYAAFQCCFNGASLSITQRFHCQQAFDWDSDQIPGTGDFDTFASLMTGPTKEGPRPR